MRNRILKRPMFRMGGSTEGIMSGLDTPKLEASRQGYSDGKRVIGYRPDETAAELSSANVLAGDVRELFPELQSLRKELISRERGRGAPGSVSNFLTGFGLNLLSQPGGSNIFQTAAKAAQTPYQQFVSARQREQDLETARDEALFGDTVDAARRIREAQIEASKKEEGTFADISKSERVGQLTDDISDLEKEQEDALRTIKEATAPQTGSDIDIEERKPGLAEAKKDAEDTLKRVNKQLKSKRNQLGSLKKDPLTGFYGSELEQRIVAAVERSGKFGQEGDPEFEKEVRRRALEAINKAEGGRIGYQEGSMVEAPTRTEVQNLDFSTLRSRLPQEISDDIVKLISDSGEALTDFANIRTQQDVDDFNQTYKVNLVLPAEV